MADRELPGPLRASDAERERAAELLGEAMSSGRLNVDELDDRMRRVFAATTRAELEGLVNDVLVPIDDRHPIAAGAARPSLGAPRLPVRQGADGTRRILSILSGSERKGRWRVSAACSVVNVLGGTELDLTEAELASDRVELKIVTVLGGGEITVPEGLNVEISEVAILGGNGVDIREAHPDPGGPVVHVRLITILGGVEIRRGRKLSRRQRKELDGVKDGPSSGVR
jgi:Domain of unknown function (DUF1707)